LRAYGKEQYDGCSNDNFSVIKKVESVWMAMIKVREVEDTDLISLAEFLPEGFPYTTKDFWLRIFELWWSLNPAYTDLFPRGWLLERDKLIVGFIGNIPVRFLVGGAVRIAAASNSWYVDPSARGIYSFVLLNEFLKQDSASLFLFKGEHNKHIMNILSKYKFEENILPLSQKEYVYIIDKKKVYSNFKKFLLGQRMPQLSQLLEYSKRTVFLLFAYLYQKPVIQGGAQPSKGYICSLCTSCDDAFYRLWKQFPHPRDVSISHDKETLNWLYFSSARFYKRVVIQCHRSHDKKLVGYMVFDLLRKKMSDVGSMQLTDLCVENNEPAVLGSLISFAIDLGKQHNAALLIVWANSPETETYFHSRITMRRTVQHYRYVKFSDIPEMQVNRDNYDNIWLPMTYPPQ
jgi:hypothetical protein